MALTAADVRQWVEGFEAAERADIEASRRAGPRSEWSIRLALSLLRAARLAAGDRSLIDARRSQQDEAVRAIWARLRARVPR